MEDLANRYNQAFNKLSQDSKNKTEELTRAWNAEKIIYEEEIRKIKSAHQAELKDLKDDYEEILELKSDEMLGTIQQLEKEKMRSWKNSRKKRIPTGLFSAGQLEPADPGWNEMQEMAIPKRYDALCLKWNYIGRYGGVSRLSLQNVINRTHPAKPP